MSEKFDASEIMVGGQPLMGNLEAEAQEETNEPQQESEATQEEVFDDEADIQSAESYEEVDATSDFEEDSNSTDVPLFSDEELSAFNSGVSQYTEGNYESIDSLIEAHDTLYDQVQDLQEQLKAAQNSTGLPEEQDEFIKGLIEYYKETGDVSEYIEAKSVDYSAMSDLDIVRRNMRSQYSNMSEKNFERLFRREVVDKYQLDASQYDEEEVELGEELLKAEASKLRSELIERQQRFKAPEREVQSEVDATAQAEEAMAQWAESVKSSPETQRVINDGRVVIDFNGETFAYEIDNPQSVVDMTIDNNKFFQLFQGEGGQIDYNKWYKVMNYASDPDTFERSLILHGKNLGGKEVVTEIKNPSRPRRAATSSGGDSKEDFLQAALRAMGK